MKTLLETVLRFVSKGQSLTAAAEQSSICTGPALLRCQLFRLRHSLMGRRFEAGTALQISEVSVFCCVLDCIRLCHKVTAGILIGLRFDLTLEVSSHIKD